jgi:hypothetical protein
MAIQNDTNPLQIGDINLEGVINAKLNWELEELTNLVATTLHKEIILMDNTTSTFYQSLPQNIKLIFEGTNGQLIYKDQASKLFCLFTKANHDETIEWIKQWNKKLPSARTLVNELLFDNISLGQIIQNLSAYTNSQFFIEKPLAKAQAIYDYLQSKRVLTRGGLDIRTLKVGSLTYEYKNLIKSWFTELEQHKIYHRCAVCVVTKAPERRSDGCWEWEAESISDNRTVIFTVCKDGKQAAPYLFDHKKWDAENFI